MINPIPAGVLALLSGLAIYVSVLNLKLALTPIIVEPSTPVPAGPSGRGAVVRFLLPGERVDWVALSLGIVLGLKLFGMWVGW